VERKPSAERNRAQQTRQAQDKREQDKLRQRQATPPVQSARPKQVDKGPGRADGVGRASSHTQPVARIRATDEQRRGLRQGLFRQSNVQRIARNRLGIVPAVGNHIPRRHRLHRFTPALIAFAPLYATYSYIVVDDTICIVDPVSYDIVDVIDEGSFETAGPPLAPSQNLLLSPEEMHLVYADVPKEPARTELRIRLALGTEVPRSVTLFAFPDAVIAQVPKVAPFRYIVVDDDVVIVDPADYEIAMVISE
jgi:uncharacterized protein DUF1236